MEDLVNLGEGYDDSDSFIDDSEAVSKIDGNEKKYIYMYIYVYICMSKRLILC